MRNTTKQERWLFAVATSVLCWSAIAFSGVEPCPWHAASSRVALPPGYPGMKPQRAIFTMAQPFAAHARIGGGASPMSAGAASTPSRVGIGFDYLLQQASFCNCGCLADPTCDGVTDIRDVVGTVNVAFRGESTTPMLDCQAIERTDSDCSGATDVRDVVHVINVAFRGGNPATEFCSPCQ